MTLSRSAKDSPGKEQWLAGCRVMVERAARRLQFTAIIFPWQRLRDAFEANNSNSEAAPRCESTPQWSVVGNGRTTRSSMICFRHNRNIEFVLGQIRKTRGILTEKEPSERHLDANPRPKTESA